MVLVFIGTYTEARAEGVFVFRWDGAIGVLTPLSAADAGPNPTYLALHPTLPLLYAANEVGESGGCAGGSVTALGIEAEGERLIVKERQTVTGTYPCHISLHPALRHLLVANYTGGDGSVGVLALAPNGALSALTDFVRHAPEKSHAHCILADPGGRYVLATDLGQNCIFVYRFDEAQGTLMLHSPASIALPGPSDTRPRGVGPRHLTFSPDGRFVYCVNEYASTITVFAWDPTAGTLEEIQTVTTLPATFSEKNTGAAIHFSPDGRHLYASNRGHDSLAILSVNRETGHLTVQNHVATGGKHPRSFAFTPDGAFALVANRDSNNLVVFQVDQVTGDLVPTGHQVDVPRPVCVKTVAVERRSES